MNHELASAARDRRECNDLVSQWKKKLRQGTRHTSTSTARMGLGAAAVVADEPVMGDLEAWLLTFCAYHRNTPVLVICDVETSRYVGSLVKEWRLEYVEVMPHMNAATQGTIEKRLEKVATESDYWKIVPIWWKIYALQQAVAVANGKGALIADCDITFCRSLIETYAADVVLSPFHWVDWGHSVIGRHGVFNAGFLMTRHQLTAGTWLYMYEEGMDGFYEQKCMERLPGLFHCDYFGREHNHGIWRKEPPDGNTASVHIHTHTPPTYPNWGLYDHAMEHLDRARHILGK